MTLPRTKHRREARKRARARKQRGGDRSSFIVAPWIGQIALELLKDRATAFAKLK